MMLGVKLLLATLAATGIFFAGESLATWSTPLAQQAPAASGGITAEGAEAFVAELVKSLGPVGFIVWFCYHTVAKTLPAKDAQIERIVTEHRAAVKELTEAVQGMVEHCKSRGQ